MTSFEYILLASGLFIAAIVFNVIRNHKIILKKSAVNHTKEWFVKACSCLPAVYCFAQASNLTWVAALVISSWMLMAHFWLWFSGFLNVRRNHNFFYPGSDDKTGDADSDNFLQQFALFQIALIKIGLVLVSTYLYILGYST